MAVNTIYYSPPTPRLSELSHYQDVLKHPAFIKDPMATIAEHVQNSVTAETV